jgi:predicted HicB family RNase H-like nuclease
MSKAAELLQQAEKLAQTVESWADLSNLLFDPFAGLVSTAFSSREARKQFSQTEEFARIQGLLEQARERFGLVEGANPKMTGPFYVGLPASLFNALEQEAAAAGKSLNQLVIARLSQPPGPMAQVS